MSFIEFVSSYFANKLVKKVPNDKFPTLEDQIEVYTYWFMFCIGAFIKIILLIILSTVIGVLPYTMIIAITFCSLRSIAGGYHMQTYNKCAVVSITMFIVSALLIKYILHYWLFVNILYLLIFCIFASIYIIYRYVPCDNASGEITKPSEIKKFKRWSSYYLFIWTIIMTISLLFNLKIIVISSCFGLLLELFSISRIGQVVYSALDSQK